MDGGVRVAVAAGTLLHRNISATGSAARPAIICVAFFEPLALTSP
jgi:hypothetical protein